MDLFGHFGGLLDITTQTAVVNGCKPRVSKQDQAEALHIVFNTYRNHNPTSALQISTVFNGYGPIGGHFGGLVADIVATKTAFVNG
jgi:hypothetical protein